ncbi:MAG: c-type cytochrome [Bacteroidia bacterium]
MFKSILITHQVAVIIFFLIYVIKTILLLSNKKDVLAKFTKAVKVPEIIVSVLFLVTGIYLMTQIPEINHFLIIKISLVFLSIPVAIVGFKKGNKILAALSLLMLTASYGLAEMSRKKKVVVSENAVTAEGTIKGDVLYVDNCALCHGADGRLGMTGAADLSKTQMDAATIKATILNGKGNMKAVALSPEQADAVAAYVETSLKGK